MSNILSFDPPLDVDACARRLNRARRALASADTTDNEIAVLQAEKAVLQALLCESEARRRQLVRTLNNAMVRFGPAVGDARSSSPAVTSGEGE
ncbi:hypothetical protein HDIA_1969 [Hartmannibacter diazotrophicus]|uniref:Uncharacterized protein n=1 Tax=Hartmannibacter diazotrophicus TaxID=1482074 RepID=A0A2C9D5P6_9HYPH|nr:hypothetical protein [Hartmannibacter diazotrophicus]SON55510.1 hypothetical protein HDIA_1969 [Hartmannibacter diazotrophicus]